VTRPPCWLGRRPVALAQGFGGGCVIWVCPQSGATGEPQAHQLAKPRLAAGQSSRPAARQNWRLRAAVPVHAWPAAVMGSRSKVTRPRAAEGREPGAGGSSGIGRRACAVPDGPARGRGPEPPNFRRLAPAGRGGARAGGRPIAWYREGPLLSLRDADDEGREHCM